MLAMITKKRKRTITKQNGQLMAEDKCMSDYERLVQFIPWLQEDDVGEWVFDKENDGSPDHPKHAPYFRYSKTVNRFLDALFAETKKLSEKDGHFEYHEAIMESGLSWHPSDLEEADVSCLPAKTILAMLTSVVAGERFCDGLMARFITKGFFVRWLERLKVIDEQNSSFSPDADLPEMVDLVMELSNNLSQEVSAFFLECRPKNLEELNDYLFDRFVVWHRRIYEVELSKAWAFLDTCSEEDYDRVHPTVAAMEKVVDHLHTVCTLRDDVVDLLRQELGDPAPLYAALNQLAVQNQNLSYLTSCLKPTISKFHDARMWIER